MGKYQAISELYSIRNKEVKNAQKKLCKTLKFAHTLRYKLRRKKGKQRYFKSLSDQLDTYCALHSLKVTSLQQLQNSLLQTTSNIEQYRHQLQLHKKLESAKPGIIAKRSSALQNEEITALTHRYIATLHRNVSLLSELAHQEHTYLKIIVASLVHTQSIAQSIFPAYAQRLESTHIIEHTIATGIFSGTKKFESAQSVSQLEYILDSFDADYEFRIAELESLH